MNITEIKAMLLKKWPQASYDNSSDADPVYPTDIPELDRLFVRHGLPFGQLLEITGSVSSGKTSLLYKMLAAFTRKGRAVYIDLSSSFFPAAAVPCGVDIDRLLVVKPESAPTALRAAELLLQNSMAFCVVIDLVNETKPLPQILLHRLRMETVRHRGLVVFLTDPGTPLFPSSTVSLRLTVSRLSPASIEVTVTKSRISREGVKTELSPL